MIEKEALREAIERALAGSQDRVFSMHVEGTKIWVKRAVVAKRRVWHSLQGLFAGLLRMDMLRATCDTEGQIALEREAVLINGFAQKGIRVPEVIMTGPGWIALSDIGESLRLQLNRLDSASGIREIVLEGADALAAAHQRGCMHGNPFVRNLTSSSEGIGFIDFEEDPLKTMSSAACQSRDILLFLQSLEPYEKFCPGLMREALTRLSVRQPLEVLLRLRRFRMLLSPVALLLKPFGKKLGRDARGAVALHEALAVLAKPLNPLLGWSFAGGLGALILLWWYSYTAS